MADLKIYDHASGPNPWKVKMILEELGIKYETEAADFATIHQRPFTLLNPNGRVPVIIDHKNGDFKLWESGAIIEYLIEKYDKQHTISHATDNERFLEKQWLYFQTSGQGPYYGQAAWFKMFHAEKIPSAIERYEKQAQRVMEVLEDHLKTQGTKYLVSDKPSYADISFVTWQGLVDKGIAGDFDYRKELPHFTAWLDALRARPAVKKVIGDYMAANAKK